MSRVGVFVCHCGENIAGTVDVAAVAKAALDMPGVVHAVEYKYMCSDPGQTMLKDAIRDKKLDALGVKLSVARRPIPKSSDAVALITAFVPIPVNPEGAV